MPAYGWYIRCKYTTVKYLPSNFAFDPHPQPLSQRERGEKVKNFSVPPLLSGEGVRGGGQVY